MLDALRLVERGEATPEDVDTAMKLGAGEIAIVTWTAMESWIDTRHILSRTSGMPMGP